MSTLEPPAHLGGSLHAPAPRPKVLGQLRTAQPPLLDLQLGEQVQLLQSRVPPRVAQEGRQVTLKGKLM